MGPQRSKGNGENTDNTNKIKSFGAGASRASAIKPRAVLNPPAGQIYPPIYPDAFRRAVCGRREGEHNQEEDHKRQHGARCRIDCGKASHCAHAARWRATLGAPERRGGGKGGRA